MKNIITYVNDVSQISFEELKFSATDSLVLSQLSYLQFNRIMPCSFHDLPVSTNNTCELLMSDMILYINHNSIYHGVMHPRLNKLLLTLLAKSSRYGSIRIRYFVSIHDQIAEKQFSAITFVLEDGSSHITFRGTDTSLIGWKEDLNMAFISPIPSQAEALNYLVAVSDLLPGPLRVGGHSKGGNLAVYASMLAPQEVQDRIDIIYSHDGPGFPNTIFEDPEFKEISSKIHKYIPQSSIIGMILQHQETGVVIESRQIGILQHDPFSWVVDKRDFKYVATIKDSAQLMDNALNQWITSLSDEQRETFVECLFQILASTNAVNFFDLIANWQKNAMIMFDTLKNIDKETLGMCTKSIEQLFIILNQCIHNYNLKKLGNMRLYLRSKHMILVKTGQKSKSSADS